MDDGTNVHQKRCFNEGVDNKNRTLLVLERSILWQHGRMPSFCLHVQRPTEDYTVISQFQTTAINWVPELIAGVLLPTTDPLISDSAYCTISASNMNAQFFEDVFFLCSPIVSTAFFQDTIAFLSIPPNFFYGKIELFFWVWKGGWSIAIEFERAQSCVQNICQWVLEIPTNPSVLSVPSQFSTWTTWWLNQPLNSSTPLVTRWKSNGWDPDNGVSRSSFKLKFW